MTRPLRQLLLGGALEHDLLVVSTQPRDVQNGERVAQDADARHWRDFGLRCPSLTQFVLQLVLSTVSEHVGHEQLVDDEEEHHRAPVTRTSPIERATVRHRD